MSFLDPLLDVMAHGAEVIRLEAIAYDTEVPDELTTRYTFAADVTYLNAIICGAEVRDGVGRVMAVGAYARAHTCVSLNKTD
jgi:hypothetical protein